MYNAPYASAADATAAGASEAVTFTKAEAALIVESIIGANAMPRAETAIVAMVMAPLNRVNPLTMLSIISPPNMR